MYDRYRMDTDLDEVARCPRVSGVDFFRQLPRTRVDSAIGPTLTPNFYYRISTVWALVHGLAFLHLDGKLDISTPEVVADQVHAAVSALFDASPALSPAADRGERAIGSFV